ncbi:unnamed protein product [Orchesella dallaii]|uniref:Uncharacterized protein n=1 Tax=Orchesella dallaii TaxID=48710 RepID=A0ABP1QQ86_9HEXA
MRLSRSMDNLQILPEEAKMAASLLKLTLSDNRQTCPTDFQTYISQHSQFPYHKNVQKSASAPSKICEVSPRPVTMRRKQGSVLISTCAEKNNNVHSSCMLSQSAPPESEGFFRRLFPSFRRKSLKAESGRRPETVMICRQVPISRKSAEVAGPVVLQFTTISSNMDNLIFMSLR